jgi:ankyrin repeat protein
MPFQKMATKKTLFSILKLLIGLLILFNSISCGCGNSGKHNNNKKGENNESPSSSQRESASYLGMKIFPMHLSGDNKQITARFILPDNNNIADLEQYKLRITLVKADGISGISYKDKDNTHKTITDKLEESLIHFFPATEFISNNEALLKIPFNIITNTESNSVRVIFELLDKNNIKLKEYPVSWSNQVSALIQLKIGKLNYDKSSSSIICNVQNNGKEPIRDIQLRYTNISQDNISKEVTINNQRIGIINFAYIAAGGLTEDQVLPIDFKSATKAKFKFEVLHQDNLAENATEEREFNDKFPQLKLLAVGSTALTGKEKVIQLRIEKANSSGNIDVSKLELKAIQNTKTDAYLQYNGKAITSIIGSELSLTGNSTALFIQSATALRASFELYLMYEQNVIDKQIFTWKIDSDQATSILSQIAAEGKEEMINELLQIPGIDINVKNENDETPLHEAAKNNHPSVVKLLASQENTQVNAKDKQGYTPLSIAIEQRNMMATLFLLQSTKINVNTTTKWGNSPLHLAIQTNSQRTVEELIAKGANINATNNHGITPLHIATSLGSTKAIALLLAEGANINVMDEDGNTPLHIAAENGQQPVIELLLATKSNVKMIDKRGLTPLHKAALANNKLAIQALLARKANVNAEDMYGNTPLHKAAQRGDEEAVNALLVAKDIDLYAKDNDSSTPLHVAVLYENEKVVTALIAKGIKVDVKDKYDNIPLHIAVQRGNLTIIRKLLKKKVGIDAKDSMGYTPLHMAICYNHSAIVKFLLTKRAKINIKNAQEETAVDLAQRSSNGEIKGLLGITDAH